MTREEWGIREADIRHALEDLWYSTNRFSAEDYCRLCAGEISVNDIRSKLGLAPLQCLGCSEPMLLEPTGYIPLVGLELATKAREYGGASESAAVRDFFERSRDFADQNISKFAEEEHERSCNPVDRSSDDICRIIDALHKDPLDAESVADVCTGECTLNQARSKLGLAPLDFEEANKKVLFYSDAIRHGRLAFAADPVRERFQNSNVEFVRKFWKRAQNEFN